MADPFMAVYVAYSIVWAGVCVFLFYLYMRQRSINRDLRALKEELHGRAQ